MASAPLTVLKGGINRLRTKGAARADQLYDLVNGYLTNSGTAVARPGTTRTTSLNALTRGLAAFQGRFITFCHQVVAVPDNFDLMVLVHPDQDPGETPIALEKIHFAKPFLGFMYVAAEFEDGAIYHYWLQSGTEWAAETMYRNGDLVQPTDPNGLAYAATRSIPVNTTWKAGTPRTVGDKVEPTTYNGFYYEVVDTAGATPASGDTEPVWPESEGAEIVESTDITPEPPPSDPLDPNQIAQDILNRYGNGFGG